MTSSKENYSFDKLEYEYSEMNVFDAAMERIHTIHSLFDHIFISFSGGKDSLVCLKLFELYRKAHGIEKKLDVVFYDEELVDSRVIKFCEEIMNSGKYNFQWWCMQLESEKYILGNKEKYIQWDINRPHIRPIPSWALTCDGVRYQDKAYLEYTKDLKGKIAVVLGLRADESINRRKAIFATRNIHCYMNTEERNATVVKPIYDWKEKDVFKFFYEYKIKYCETYDYQIFNRDKLRVSTPLHAEAAQSALLTMKTKDPVLYNQMLAVFPEVELQVRYSKDYKPKRNDYSNYPVSWEGVIKFAKDIVADEFIEDVLNKIMQCKRYREKHETHRPLGGFPILYVFNVIANGRYKRMIPALHNEDVTKKYYDYEGLEYNI
ncbi:MAG: phosphoadenosine phosphosulfate reductase family protein [Bacteroidales bacterium]|jgi:predicted phosphoadenosine phosphosulfate sulfurtransferase|nr:phosphoadenosine phosphosulfate reductase family protein [Bacteroidales bacterium]